jgi:hypothetical protein
MTRYIQCSGRVFGSITASLSLDYGVRDIIANLKRFSFRLSVSVAPKGLPIVGVHSSALIAGFGWQVDVSLKDGPLLVAVGAGAYTPVISAAVSYVL